MKYLKWYDFILLIFLPALGLVLGSFAVDIDKQQTIESEVYKRCLDSDIYNEFQCYNMIIKVE